MIQPSGLIFSFLRSQNRVQVWLNNNNNVRIEGRIIGFDDYMNLVLSDAEEIRCHLPSHSIVNKLGKRIYLKGENISLICCRCDGCCRIFEANYQRQQRLLSPPLLSPPKFSTV